MCPPMKPQIHLQMCEGTFCGEIIELPYEGYSNVKYCPDCAERINRENARLRRKKERHEFLEMIAIVDHYTPEHLKTIKE